MKRSKLLEEEHSGKTLILCSCFVLQIPLVPLHIQKHGADRHKVKESGLFPPPKKNVTGCVRKSKMGSYLLGSSRKIRRGH